MSLLKKMTLLLLLAGLYNPAFAAVDGFEPALCSVYSEAEGGDKKEGEEEEEPDCE